MKPTRNRYGKRSWLDTPLSKPYKARLALATAWSASRIAQGIARINAISGAKGNAVQKAKAIGECVVSTHTSVSLAMTFARNGRLKA